MGRSSTTSPFAGEHSGCVRHQTDRLRAKAYNQSLHVNHKESPMRQISSAHGLKFDVKSGPERRPVTLAYQSTFASRSDACKEEFRIKQLSRREKDALIASVRALQAANA